ncbi:transcriptional regulator, AraC family [Fibrisoma limi BUZ 3]|uniref:Transcriptional regulator, AraC family n=1 Tax=Fibrisoma limi BUZ 3 TaxID=1185876 RepID=I2GLQ3_9BACT|nr:helix-turn-helix domain-containing protein [Fibrisoma limi]CCH54829.1 transcriptional regulator, AraC family [Fibrisoma limi BUZ 3]
MNSQLIEADERLATVFSHYYCVQQGPQDAPLQQQLVPNYEMLLVFNFGPAISGSLGDAPYVISRTAVLGPLQKTLTYELPAGADLIVVNFTLNGFYRLLRVPMQELKTQDIHNPDVLLNKPCFEDIWSQLAQMTTLADRLQLLNEYALTYAAPADSTTNSMIESIPYVNNTVVEPVKLLATQQQVSARMIQLTLQKQLGYSARELVRFLRFKKVLTFLFQQPTPSVDWLSLVSEYGYHDQSHLIKDFQQYMGISPRQFINQLAQGGMCISKPGKFY